MEAAANKDFCETSQIGNAPEEIDQKSQSDNKGPCSVRSVDADADVVVLSAAWGQAIRRSPFDVESGKCPSSPGQLPPASGLGTWQEEPPQASKGIERSLRSKSKTTLRIHKVK